jgi:antitoxin component YwqK of YwqJK toxin-antitoxin module
MLESAQKNAEMVRVNVDDTDIEYTGGPIVTFEGKPFTGIAYEIANDGHLISEITYIEGIQNGPDISWHFNGKLESEGENKWNRPHGFFKEWYESGQLKMEGLTELGYVIWRKQYDEEGNLTSEYKIENRPDQLRSLDADRSWAKQYDSLYSNLSVDISREECR